MVCKVLFPQTEKVLCKMTIFRKISDYLILPHEAKIFSTASGSGIGHLGGWHDGSTSHGASCSSDAGANTVTATAQNNQQTTATPDRSGKNLVSARKVNDTTIELINNQKQRITLDFYGNGIFRLYLDPAGRAPHNPEATPCCRHSRGKSSSWCEIA